ncbi:MAG: serine hydrolase [Anaerolineales bacterium]
MNEKRGNGIWLLFVLISLLVLAFAWLYTGWRSSQRVLPHGVTLGGLPVGGMTREQALNTLAEAYSAPLTVYYREKEILLVPEMVELALNVDATTEQLNQILLAQSGPQGFIDYLVYEVRGGEAEVQEVSPILNYERARLDAFLARTAQQFDHPPLEPVPLPEAGTFRPPEPGTTLDQKASLPLLVAALLSPTQKEVVLVVEMEPIPPASLDFLHQALEQRLEGFTGVAGIFIKNLDSGQQLCYNCEVAFSGLSTLKIGIVPAFYRDLDVPPTPETTRLISATLTGSNNAAANLLLAEIGAGDPYTGALKVTEFLQGLGLESTYIAAPYDLKAGVEEPDIVTPGNGRTDFYTEPDPYIQTSPLDIGLLLEGLCRCAQGGGHLRLLYPQEITPLECEQTLNWMEQNRGNSLLGEGMPPETRIAHKHGWAEGTHADVALVESPNAKFVIAVFLYQPNWLVWEESAPTFADIGQLAYRFFNPAP